MTGVEVRQALADAASTVAGITARPFYAENTAPGHTFIRLERIDYDNAFAHVYPRRRWNVVVLLPQDPADAERYLEDKLPELVEALTPELVIASAVPQRIQFPDVGVLPCVVITGHREAD